MSNAKMKAAGMDLHGEERFGPVMSRIYNVFASSGVQGLYEFACLDILGKKGAFSLLDVGTGPGRLPEMLASRQGRIRIYAVDPSPSMLRIARNRRGNRGVKFALGYSRRIPFSLKFGMIISTLSFHHWVHKKESLQYLSQFLERGGEIRIYERVKSGRLLDRFVDMHSAGVEELREIAHGTGLRVKGIVVKDKFVRAAYVKK